MSFAVDTEAFAVDTEEASEVGGYAPTAHPFLTPLGTTKVHASRRKAPRVPHQLSRPVRQMLRPLQDAEKGIPLLTEICTGIGSDSGKPK